jgi:hypothetical protein
MITISLEEEKEWQSRRKEAKEFLKERENEEYSNMICEALERQADYFLRFWKEGSVG